MADIFILTLEYDRDKIVADAQKVLDKGSNLYQARNFLEQFYPAWQLDARTSFLVELMYRDENDPLRPLFEKRLAELDAARELLEQKLAEQDAELEAAKLEAANV